MNTAISNTGINLSKVLRHDRSHRNQVLRTEDCVFTRETAVGPFSLLGHGPVRIDADPRLVIRVHAGCLWVPNHEELCSVGVGAGEHFVVREAGKITALAITGTQIELKWPSREVSAPSEFH